MNGKNVNLHTHTVRCKHAKGSVADYCKAAQACGIKVLGFTEHSPFPDNRLVETRPAFEELEDYCREIRAAREAFPGLVILSGLEVDTDTGYPPEYFAELKEKYALDYLAAGCHFVRDPAGEIVFAGVNKHHPTETVELFIRKSITLIESGIFSFITHPDMVTASIDDWQQVETLFTDLALAAKKHRIPLEINAYGLRKKAVVYDSGESRHPYPYLPFWQLCAKEDVPCIIGSDAHIPEDLGSSSVSEVWAFAEKLGLAPLNAETAQSIQEKI